MRFIKGVGVIVLLLCVSNVCAQEDRIGTLEQRIMAQQQLIQNLENQVQERENAPARIQGNYAEGVVAGYANRADLDEGDGVTMGYDKGFFLRTEDGDFELRLGGHIMSVAHLSGRHTVQNDTFYLRQSQLDFQAIFFQNFVARIRMGFDQNTSSTYYSSGGYDLRVRIREAYLEYLAIPEFKFRVGATKIPFSMEFFQDRTDQLAIAFSPFLMITAMPRRDAGILIHGDGLPFLAEFFEDHFGYALGVFNGDSDRGTSFDSEGQIRSNYDDDFLYVGAIRFYPFGVEEQKVFLHTAVFYRDTDFWEDGGRILLDGMQNHEVYGIDWPAGGEDVDDTNGDQFGVDVGFQWWRDNLRFEAEFMYMRLSRDMDRQTGVIPQDREALEMFGYSAAIAYFFQVSDENEEMGLEPFVKVSYTTIDDREKDDSSTADPLGTVTNVRGQDIWEFAIGLRYHFNSHVRFDFNYLFYDLREDDYGLSNQTSSHNSRIMPAVMFQFVARW